MKQLPSSASLPCKRIAWSRHPLRFNSQSSRTSFASRDAGRPRSLRPSVLADPRRLIFSSSFSVGSTAPLAATEERAVRGSSASNLGKINYRPPRPAADRNLIYKPRAKSGAVRRQSSSFHGDASSSAVPRLHNITHRTSHRPSSAIGAASVPSSGPSKRTGRGKTGGRAEAPRVRRRPSSAIPRRAQRAAKRPRAPTRAATASMAMARPVRPLPARTDPTTRCVLRPANPRRGLPGAEGEFKNVLYVTDLLLLEKIW